MLINNQKSLYNPKLLWVIVFLIYLMMIGVSVSGSHGGFPLNLPSFYYFLFLLGELFLFTLFIIKAGAQTWKSSNFKSPDPKVRRLAQAGLIGLFVQFCLGILVRGTQSGLACPRFPICAESFFPIPLTLETALAWIHRWWGVLMLGLFVQLAIATAKKSPALATSARRALGLSFAQVFIGIGTIMSGLEIGSRTTHAAIGYALWGILFSIFLRTQYSRHSMLQKRM